jgi:hypothetical protein
MQLPFTSMVIVATAASPNTAMRSEFRGGARFSGNHQAGLTTSHRPARTL